MCGLAGIFAYHVAAANVDPAELASLTDQMRRRGPDGRGLWHQQRIGLGHRRLAILDLSDAGAQPMSSADGRYRLVFNGEIYNHPELMRELRALGVEYRGSSDTETILHWYAREGVAAFARLRGMYAIAIWDTLEGHLTLARDPYGIKPLYCADDGWTLRFASSVKALATVAGVDTALDPAGLTGFLLWGSVPEPWTCHRGIRALPAGHWQRVDALGPRAPVRFADVAGAFQSASAPRMDTGELQQAVGAAVRESIAAHLLADVEVGVFLSAGIDSSVLYRVATEALGRPPVAVTVDFADFRGGQHDEASLARDWVRQHGGRHHVATISAAEFHAAMPEILAAMDQPSIDGINTWFVSRAAREAGLKVALSGVGGDELFGGYDSFETVPRWARQLRWPARMPGAGPVWRVLARQLRGLQTRQPKIVGLLDHGASLAQCYLLKRALFLPSEIAGLLGRDLATEGLRRLQSAAGLESIVAMAGGDACAQIGALESLQYLRNQLLRDADWAGMDHSLEIRTPLVDYRLLQTCGALLPQVYRSGRKQLLARAPREALPTQVLERPKTGFSVPLSSWLADGAPATPLQFGAGSRRWALQLLGTLGLSVPEAA
ncbi:MAG: asparagine synthase (glutamine-hydrolyzing) [Xanthomonadales bacterium]|jgi:asparagine synthase (glutamine-hydrolysing)|nr:asparagine synthase (glutamine-hydrolyzing) [Xanthomonadales bacterium]